MDVSTEKRRFGTDGTEYNGYCIAENAKDAAFNMAGMRRMLFKIFIQSVE